MATDCPTIGPWFVKFVRGVNLRVGVIREQYLGMSALTIFALQRVWDIEWESVIKTYIAKIVEIAAAVLIGFCGGLGGEDILWTP